MKYYAALLFCIPLATAQQRSATSYTYDVNGHPMGMSRLSDSAAPGAERKATTVRNVNGRNVPVESVDEHVVSDAGGVRIVERTIKRYDANGNPGPAEKVRIEERKAADGSSTVLTTVMRGDLNGSYSVAERTTAEIRKSGDTTTTTTTVERQTPNGSFDTVGKREETERKGANGDVAKNAITYQRDMNGRLYESAREDVQQTKRGDVVEENAAVYEATNGQLQLVKQTVSRTAKAGNGEQTEVNVFLPSLPGKAQTSDAKPQLREQQIIEKKPSGNGTVETLSVRWSTPNAPGQLGPAQKVQETVCTGDCK